MSISDTSIQLDDQEVEKIITDDQGDMSYIVEVVGEHPVRISHVERYASDGTTLSAGQTHTVSNLKGERLYASAYDGPTAIRVREAAADVTSQPEKEVSVIDGSVNVGSVEISDRSSREIGKARLQDSSGVLVDPATSSDVSATQPRSIDGPVDVKPSPNALGIKTFAQAVAGYTTLPSMTVADGESVVLKADINNEYPITVEDTFRLDPGEALSVKIQNTNQIEVEAPSGVIRAIVEDF